MSAGFDRVGLNVERQGNEVVQDEEKAPANSEVPKTAVIYADMKLKSLVSSDEMYYAMEHFLLGNPEKQVPMFGEPESVLKAADEARAKNDNINARTNYEVAAKLDLYHQDKEGLRNALILAQEVTEENERFFPFQRAILDNIDEALRVAKAYYADPGSKVI